MLDFVHYVYRNRNCLSVTIAYAISGTLDAYMAKGEKGNPFFIPIALCEVLYLGPYYKALKIADASVVAALFSVIGASGVYMVIQFEVS